jgi:hypothetical protein
MKRLIFDPINLIILIVLLIIRGWKKTVAAWQGTKVGGYITERYNQVSGWLSHKIFHGLDRLVTFEASSFSNSLVYKYYELYVHKYVSFLSRFWKKMVEAWQGTKVGGYITERYNRFSGWLSNKIFHGLDRLVTFEASSFSNSLVYKYYELHCHKYVVSLSSRWNRFVEALTGTSVGGFIVRKYNRYTRKLGKKVFQFLERMIRWEARPFEDTLMYGYYRRYGRKAKKSASRVWARVLATQSGSVSASHAHRSYKLYNWMLGSIWDKHRFAILTVVIAIIASAIIIMLSNTSITNRSSYQDSSVPAGEEVEIIFEDEQEAEIFYNDFNSE